MSMDGEKISKFSIKNFANGNEGDYLIIAQIILCFKSNGDEILIRNDGYTNVNDGLYHNKECLTMGWFIANDVNHLTSLIKKSFLINCLIVSNVYSSDNWIYKIRVIEDIEGDLEILIYCRENNQIDDGTKSRLIPFFNNGASMQVSNY